MKFMREEYSLRSIATSGSDLSLTTTEFNLQSGFLDNGSRVVMWYIKLLEHRITIENRHWGQQARIN